MHLVTVFLHLYGVSSYKFLININLSDSERLLSGIHDNSRMGGCSFGR